MLNIVQSIVRRGRFAGGAAAVLALAGVALLDTPGTAQAGYTCVNNVTRVGSITTLEIIATSGGPYTNCVATDSPHMSSANISISGSVVSAKVGATNGNVRTYLTAFPQGFPPEFELYCEMTPAAVDDCTDSQSGFINGVDFMHAYVRGDFVQLPDPALPGVPVVINATFAVNY